MISETVMYVSFTVRQTQPCHGQHDKAYDHTNSAW